MAENAFSQRRSRPVVLILAAALILSACGAKKDTGSSPVPETSAAETTVKTETVSSVTAAETEETSVSAEKTEDKPEDKKTKDFQWATTVETGRLPAEKPDPKDDIYTYYNYDFLSANQGEYKTPNDAFSDELKDAVTEVIKDENNTWHSLEQLRIFYAQAADLEKINSLGMSPLQPYLDMIDRVSTIEGFNELLSSEDFPFTPFISAELGLTDMKTETQVGITPRLLLFDPEFEGGTYYNDHDDPNKKEIYDMAVEYEAIGLVPDLMQTGMGSDEAYDIVTTLADFETLYGKDVSCIETFMKSDFGDYSKYVADTDLSEKELYKAAPNIPVKALLKKQKKTGAKLYITEGYDWLKTLNGLWTEENLDKLKLMAKAQIFDETRPYRDPTEYNKILKLYDLPERDSDTFAFEACSSIRLFCREMTKIYVYSHLGEKAVERISHLTREIIDAYRELIRDTAWLEEKTRDAMTEKLDNMALNILEPGEYIDMKGLELAADEEGGSLFGNYLKLKQYRLDMESKLIGTPPLKTYGWYFIPPTLENAYYDPVSNSINLLPGYVTSFVYRKDMDDSELMGGLGMAVAHEISHAFDFTGSQFDAYGRAEPIFEDEDLREYLEITQKLADRFSAVKLEDGTEIDGQNVVGEAAADLSAIQIIIEAAKKNESIDLKDMLIAFAGSWAEIIPEGYASLYAADSHPLNNLRVNVTLQMFDEVYDLYGIKEGDGMYLAPEKRVVLWGSDAS